MIANRFSTLSSGFALALALCAVEAGVARADIGNPRSHVHYGAEIEPHLVVQWNSAPDYWGSDGIGLGLRASIPVIQDGPVSSINNSLALGFGLDWAHFGDDNCWYGGPRPAGPIYQCSAENFLLPLVVQWNFFFSDLISAFPEFGLGIEHTRWDGGFCRNGRDVVYCGGRGSHTDALLLLWLGVRFHLAKSFALTLRLGTPSLTLGASFLL